MRIYLIRHGETDWNRELRLQGREDIPLNEMGREQALECGNAIKELDVDVIVSSPLTRAIDTASIIGTCIGIEKIEIEDDLIERDFGEASGITYQEKNERYKDKEIPGFESKEHMLNRMLRAIQKYSDAYPEGHVLMVSHGGAIRTTISALIKDSKEIADIRLKNACVSILEVSKEAIELVEFNMEPNQFADKYLAER